MDTIEHQTLFMQHKIAARLTVIMLELEKGSHNNFKYGLVWKEQDEESLNDMLKSVGKGDMR